MRKFLVFISCLALLMIGGAFYLKSQNFKVDNIFDQLTSKAMQKVDKVEDSESALTTLQKELHARDEELAKLRQEQEVLQKKRDDLSLQLNDLKGEGLTPNDIEYAYYLPEHEQKGTNFIWRESTYPGRLVYGNLTDCTLKTLPLDAKWSILDYDFTTGGKIAVLARMTNESSEANDPVVVIRVFLYDAANLAAEPVLLLDLEGLFNEIKAPGPLLSFSPDGRYLVVDDFGWEWDHVKVYSMETLAEVELQTVFEGLVFEDKVKFIEFYPDSDHLLFMGKRDGETVMITHNLTDGSSAYAAAKTFDAFDDLLTVHLGVLIGMKLTDGQVQSYRLSQELFATLFTPFAGVISEESKNGANLQIAVAERQSEVDSLRAENTILQQEIDSLQQGIETLRQANPDLAGQLEPNKEKISTYLPNPRIKGDYLAYYSVADKTLYAGKISTGKMEVVYKLNDPEYLLSYDLSGDGKIIFGVEQSKGCFELFESQIKILLVNTALANSGAQILMEKASAYGETAFQLGRLQFSPDNRFVLIAHWGWESCSFEVISLENFSNVFTASISNQDEKIWSDGFKTFITFIGESKILFDSRQTGDTGTSLYTFNPLTKRVRKYVQPDLAYKGSFVDQESNIYVIGEKVREGETSIETEGELLIVRAATLNQ